MDGDRSVQGGRGGGTRGYFLDGVVAQLCSAVDTIAVNEDVRRLSSYSPDEADEAGGDGDGSTVSREQARVIAKGTSEVRRAAP